MKLKLLTLLVLILLPLSLANNQIIEQGYKIFKSGEQINYNFVVVNSSGGNVGDDSISCVMLTTNSQGGNLKSVNADYDSDNELWIVSFDKNHFKDNGYYNYVIKCSDSVSSGTIEINLIGYNKNSDSIIYLIFSVILLLGVFLYLSSQYMDKDNTFGVGLYFYLISFILLVYVLFLQFSVMEKSLYWFGLTGIQLVLFYSITYSLIGIVFIGFTYLLVKYLGNIKQHKSSISYGDGYDSKSKMYKY